MKYKNIGKELTITSISKDFYTVKLSDGSRWRVKDGDLSKTTTWYPTQRIVVEKNKSPDNHVYLYKLTNLDTSEPDVAEANSS